MPPSSIRPISVDGDVAYVQLTQGQIAIIDAEDVPLVSGRNWFAQKSAGTFYAGANGPRLENGRPPLKMHRVILGAKPGEFVDHADSNGLNNRKNNIRIATVLENNINIGPSKLNKSGFKGVTLYAQSGKWRAVIAFNGRRVSLGLHETKESAHAAYVEAAKKYHGEFARW